MAAPKRLSLSAILVLCVTQSIATRITVINNCTQTLWISTNQNPSTPTLPADDADFVLFAGGRKIIAPPTAWSALLWARTGCAPRGPDSRLLCATGDCNSGSRYCSGALPTPPVTLIDLSLSGAGEASYDVSLIAGFNVPAAVAPVPVASGCRVASCPFEVNGVCPERFKVLADDGRTAVACRSACEVMKDAEGCCSPAGRGKMKCKKMWYKEMLKSKCPSAIVYADDVSQRLTCSSSADNYDVTFCPN